MAKELLLFVEKNGKVSIVQEVVSFYKVLIDNFKNKFAIFSAQAPKSLEFLKKTALIFYKTIQEQFISFKGRLSKKQRIVIERLLTTFVEVIPD
jgi:hypothetical protein